eukprot:403361377
MSYPKRSLVGSSISLTDRGDKKIQRKEQLKQLLINKFRSKFGVKANGEHQDFILQKEVTNFIENDQPTEANLINLEKRLQQVFGNNQANESHQIKPSSSITNALLLSQRSSLVMQDIQNSKALGGQISNGFQTQRLVGGDTQQSFRSRQSMGNLSHRSNSNLMKNTGNLILNTGLNPLLSPRYQISTNVSNQEVIPQSQRSQMRKSSMEFITSPSGTNFKENLMRQSQASSMFSNNLQTNSQSALHQPNDEEYWNKIVQNNLDQFNREKEEAKLKAKQNQIILKEELAKQVSAQRRAKQDELKQEQEYVSQQRAESELAQLKDNQKTEVLKLKIINEKEIQKHQQEQQLKQIAEELHQEELKEKERQKVIREQQIKEYEQNVVLRQQQKKQQHTDDITGFTGEKDLFSDIFVEKQHVSYQKRLISDQRIELIKDKIIAADTKQSHIFNQTGSVTQNQQSYLQKQEEKKIQDLKQKERQVKRYLDIQLQEQEAQRQLKKFQETQDTQVIYQDVKKYEEEEKTKKEEWEQKMREHKVRIEKQIMDQKNMRGSVQAKIINTNGNSIDINKRAINDIESGRSSIIKKPF